MKQRITAFLIPLAAFLFIFAGIALAQVEVLWLGHSTVRITSVNGKVIMIDPFLKKNPKTPRKYKNLKAIGKVDLILITHGHQDHTSDLPELARLTGAKVISNYEYLRNLVGLGLIKSDRIISMNKGGFVIPFGRGIKIHMVPAEHSSSIDYGGFGLWKPGDKGLRHVEGSQAVGYVIELENGFKIYHSGDTAVFGDMALIHEFFKPDVAMVPIGGHFTMDPKGAAYAIRNFLKPKIVIPIHYGTYPVINRTPGEFKRALGNTPVKVIVMRPGQTVKF